MGEPVIGKLITLDPAHFHGAVIQEQMLPGIDKRVSIYAPLGPGLLIHLGLIEQFNTRPKNPTSWEMDIHCSPRPLEEMIAARAGNIVVLAGHNGKKILSIKASLDAGLNVLGDKPWIIRSEDFPVLESALALANRKHLIAYDLMTERFEITRIIQRALINDPEVFGKVVPGDLENPAVIMENVHTINTSNGGRPPFFFDIHDQGTGLSDVATHLVNLIPWTLFPSQAINYRTDIKVQRCKSWSTPVSLAQFKQATGTAAFPRRLPPTCMVTSLTTSPTIRWITRFAAFKCASGRCGLGIGSPLLNLLRAPTGAPTPPSSCAKTPELISVQRCSWFRATRRAYPPSPRLHASA